MIESEERGIGKRRQDMGSVVKRLAKIVNPVAGRVAAAGIIPVWGVVVHTGRKSGRRFATPIALARTRDGFVVPLPWGPGTDWCRNLVAAQGGVIRWRGRDHVVRDPEMIDRATGAAAFPAPARIGIALFGIRRFVRLRSVDAEG